MTFNYIQQYPNGLNDNSQIRRSADFVYQRGGTYKIVITGDTYQPSMELVVNLFSNGQQVGQMAVVPYSIVNNLNQTFTYTFGVRPYSYLQNYLQQEHYQYYWLNDWDSTNQTINYNNPYPNSIQFNFKYCYRYYLNNVYVYENNSTTPTNDYNHYTYIPESINTTGYTPADYVSTGNIFDYVGGAFQLDNNFILPNFDQEVGSIIGSGFTTNTLDLYTRQSPIGQYLMDYPTVPEQSETGRFLTIAPRIQYIQSSENYVLYYLNGLSGDRQYIEADYAVFEFYDIDGNLIDTYNQELNKAGSPYESPTGYTDNLQIFSLPCGPVDINNIYTTVDWNVTAYYRVQLYYSYPTWDERRLTVGPVGPISEAFYFYQYVNCLPESTRLCWLNDQGTYDYFTFRSYRQDTKNIDRQTYDNRYYATNLSSPDRNVGRTLKTFDTTVTQQIVLNSYYLTLSQGKWLEQLFYSPQVYIINSDYISPIDRQNKIYKDLQPIQVISTSVDTITKKHSKLNKYSITLQTGNSFFINKGF